MSMNEMLLVRQALVMRYTECRDGITSQSVYGRDSFAAAALDLLMFDRNHPDVRSEYDAQRSKMVAQLNTYFKGN